MASQSRQPPDLGRSPAIEYRSQFAIDSMRKQLLLPVVVVFGLGVFIMIRMISNPLRKADTDLRTWLLGQTALGSSSSDVTTFLEKRGWYTDGFATTQSRPANDPFIAGDLGGYQGFPWYVHVSAFWEFDDHDELKDIRIRRIADSP